MNVRVLPGTWRTWEQYWGDAGGCWCSWRWWPRATGRWWWGRRWSGWSRWLCQWSPAAGEPGVIHRCWRPQWSHSSREARAALTSERSKLPLVHSTTLRMESAVLRMAYCNAPTLSQKSSRLGRGRGQSVPFSDGNPLHSRHVHEWGKGCWKSHCGHCRHLSEVIVSVGWRTGTWAHEVNSSSSSSRVQCWSGTTSPRSAPGKLCFPPTPPPARSALYTPRLQNNCGGKKKTFGYWRNWWRNSTRGSCRKLQLAAVNFAANPLNLQPEDETLGRFAAVSAQVCSMHRMCNDSLKELKYNDRWHRISPTLSFNPQRKVALRAGAFHPVRTVGWDTGFSCFFCCCFSICTCLIKKINIIVTLHCHQKGLRSLTSQATDFITDYSFNSDLWEMPLDTVQRTIKK